MSDGENKGGRPLEREEPKRSAIALRTTPTVKDRLADAAAEKGRSLTQEVEARIEQSFELDDLLSDVRTKALLIEAANEVARAERVTGKRWHADVETHEAASLLIADLLVRRRPKDDDYERGAALWREIEDLRTKIRGLEEFLKACRVLADRRNALVALAPGATQVLSEMPEDEWINPNHPGEKIDPEIIEFFRQQLAERETMLLYEHELEMRMEDTMRPRWDARARGKQLHETLTRSEI